MKLPELPDLPASQANVDVWDSEVRGLHSANAAYFSPDQMRAYALAYGQAVAEECAKLCETLDHGAFGSADFLSGVQLGSLGCANAIRNQGTRE